MKKIIYIICTFSILTIFSYCDDSYIIQSVGIERIDSTGIYFTYNYLGNPYSGFFLLNAIEVDFYTSDSLRIGIDKNQPEKYKFISVVETIWPVQEEFISITEKNNEGVIIYGYHQVEIKPLFQGANYEYDNDTAINNYFKTKYGLASNYHLIKASILIDDYGKAKLHKAYTQIVDESKFVESLIDDMPNFSSAIHNGKRVAVSYLIDVPVFN